MFSCLPPRLPSLGLVSTPAGARTGVMAQCKRGMATTQVDETAHRFSICALMGVRALALQWHGAPATPLRARNTTAKTRNGRRPSDNQSTPAGQRPIMHHDMRHADDRAPSAERVGLQVPRPAPPHQDRQNFGQLLKAHTNAEQTSAQLALHRPDCFPRDGGPRRTPCSDGVLLCALQLLLRTRAHCSTTRVCLPGTRDQTLRTQCESHRTW